MCTAQKTETNPDTRDQIGGYPLPWKIVDRDRMGGDLVDGDGEVITHFGDDEFYIDLAAGVNQASARIDAVEAALVQLGQIYFDDIHYNALCRREDDVKSILRNLGLADRLPGNPTEAEEAVSS